MESTENTEKPKWSNASDEDQTFQAIHQPDDVEVDEQTIMQTAKTEIRKHLGLVDRQKSLYGLDLYNYKSGNAHIESISSIDDDVFVIKGSVTCRSTSKPTRRSS